MLLRLWQNMQLVENILKDHNSYRMYSDIVTGDINLAMVTPDTSYYSDQAILDIEQVRILPMSHKYNPAAMHAGLLIYSIDGQTDFILNDAMLRMKSGDILIHQIHHALAGQENTYKDLIRTLFGTHRINLVGLVFTFSGSGQFTDCMRWDPTSGKHTSPIHPTEQKLIEIALVSLYMNDSWLSMAMASHADVEALSQLAKKEYILKIGEIERLFNKRRQERNEHNIMHNVLSLYQNKFSDGLHSFEWTPSRQQTFDDTMQRLLDQFYSTVEQIFQEGEFDPDQYVHYDDATKQLATGLVNSYTRSSNAYMQNYFY